MDDMGVGLDIDLEDIGMDADTEDLDFGEDNLGLDFDDTGLGKSGSHLAGISGDADGSDIGIDFSLE